MRRLGATLNFGRRSVGFAGGSPADSPPIDRCVHRAEVVNGPDQATEVSSGNTSKADAAPIRSSCDQEQYRRRRGAVMARAVGIDLGTTNSVIATVESGQPTVIANA